MAPFMFSTRKHFLKTKFTPGVLTRAYRYKKATNLKILRMVVKPDVLEYLRKVFPDKLLTTYASVCRSGHLSGRSLVCIKQFESLFQRLDPSRFAHEPSPQELEIFTTWVREYNKELHGKERTQQTMLKKRMQPLGLHASYFDAVANDHTSTEKELYGQWRERVASNADMLEDARRRKVWLENRQYLPCGNNGSHQGSPFLIMDS